MIRNALVAAALNRLPMPHHQIPNGVCRGCNEIHVYTANPLPADREIQRAPVPGIGKFVDADVQRG